MPSPKSMPPCSETLGASSESSREMDDGSLFVALRLFVSTAGGPTAFELGLCGGRRSYVSSGSKSRSMRFTEAFSPAGVAHSDAVRSRRRGGRAGGRVELTIRDALNKLDSFAVAGCGGGRGGSGSIAGDRGLGLLLSRSDDEPVPRPIERDAASEMRAGEVVLRVLAPVEQEAEADVDVEGRAGEPLTHSVRSM